MVKQKSGDRDEFQSPSLALPFANVEVFESMGRAGETWMRTFLEIQKELASFASARLKSDAETATAMARCANPAELAKLQQDWAATAFRDYAQEAGQLVQVASEAVASSAAATREAARRTEETIFTSRAAE